ncbi:MAG: hypothetical protein WDW36_007032 [Sanguina aurantia]
MAPAATKTDDTTDAWDTIDWLVKSSNARFQQRRQHQARDNGWKVARSRRRTARPSRAQGRAAAARQ